MIKLQGAKNSAIVYADKIDKQAKTQITALLRNEAYADSKIRIMPDVHAGRNVPVGTTMTLSGRVSPSLVGVDIGCGMETVFLKERDVDLRKLDEVIHAAVPCGAKIHDSAKAFFDLGKSVGGYLSRFAAVPTPSTLLFLHKPPCGKMGNIL
mgnify:CR=1 FL=1